MHKATHRFLTETLLTTEELAAYTGWSTTKIKQDFHRGKISGVKKGRTLLFDKRDFPKRGV